ncbi:hypothetical protein SAMN05421800_11096 [Chryseobacterium balustinum]|uniref:DUF6759 domain-containing protein n=2 Tax=Chryseobacterium balustinum TaxID=246 RepID=A0AAX2II10_9FLAO|nr:hypothetical protein SAMN05421800_11096 [Chryseobacterium balustinum]SQA86937.1 Uncharacterised protein [Chryseobacterium balustinum]
MAIKQAFLSLIKNLNLNLEYITMKKFHLFSLLTTLFLSSCGTVNQNTRQPTRRPFPTPSNIGTKTNFAAQTEREYQALLKTYKPETTEVLNSLFNDSSNSPNVSITVENQSNCNMVLTISSKNYFKKIPIGAHKTGAVMAPKNQNYNLSGMLCNSVYEKTKFITNSFNIKLSN